jgi:hypothetical protein
MATADQLQRQRDAANAAKTAAANAAAIRNAARGKAGLKEATANAAKTKASKQAAIDKAAKDLLPDKETGDATGGGGGGNQGISDLEKIIAQQQAQIEALQNAAKVAAADIQQAKRQDSYALLKTYAAEYGLPESIADKLIDLVMNQGYTGKALVFEMEKTQEYKDRFAGLDLYKKNFAQEIAAGSKAAPPTAADYLKYEQQYQDVLLRYGLGDLATRGTFAQLIGGDVSVAEMTDRVVNVYDKVNNADDVLKQQLNQFFPTFGTTDFARALLTGTSPQEMASQLTRKLGAAEISSEASRAGLTTGVDRAQQLQAMGVSRGTARTGYSRIAEQQTVLNKLGSIYKEDVTGLQTELEAEQFQGLASQRRKKLEQTEKASFAGRSGMSQVSLSQGTAGTL